MMRHPGAHYESNEPTKYDLVLIKRLLCYALPYKWLLLFCFLLLSVVSLAEVGIPYVTKIAIDSYIAPSGGTALTIDERWQGLLQAFGILLAIHFSCAISSVLQMYFIHVVGEKAMYDMRAELFRHIIRMKPAFFDEHPVGKLVTRVANDVNVLREFFASVLVNLFKDILLLLGIIVAMFSINVRLTLVSFSFIIPFFLLAYFLGSRLRTSWRNIRRCLAIVNAFIEEHISGISVVRIFGREESVLADFASRNSEHFQAAKGQVKIFCFYIPIVQFLIIAGTAVIYWYGGFSILGGAMTFGTLVAFVQYVRIFFRPLREMIIKYNIIQSAMAAAERVFELMDSDEFIYQEPSKEDKARAAADVNGELRLKGDIVFSDVWFAYKDEDWVLKGVSFRVPSGGSLAFVGATGAGKTSIISLLLRHYEFQRGTITVDGRDIRTIPVRELRQSFGCVRQDVFTFSGTIGQNIRLSREATDDDVSQAAGHANALRFINELPDTFDTQVGERGQMLSMGQRQLLSFSRVILHNPSILLLDEATSNVDTRTEQEIQTSLSEMVRTFTSIVVAHRLSTVMNVDKIIVLHKGKVREEGTHGELLSRGGLYTKLYELATAFGEWKDEVSGAEA